MERVKIGITGIVQGVGFRPFVYNLARSYGLCGWVLNDAGGVRIEVEGESESLTAFVNSIRVEAPPLAVIDRFTVERGEVKGDHDFTILKSQDTVAKVALVSPDVATCPDCRQEITAADDRRYRYPFTNCTNCGPRYTIIRDVPYDRERTTMASFPMCPACLSEYQDPADRRFHAQPNACPVCGPTYTLLDRNFQQCEQDPLAKTAELVRNGAIIAVKGLGGYHLACDARNNEAVTALRDRKYREDKPFAVMCGSIEAVKRLCVVTAEEELLLSGTVRPIVLLAKSAGYDLADAVAPGNPFLGVMLPYAPVHWLLLAPDDIWVMTSGNVSDEPIVIDDVDARARLAEIADYFLEHNRPIYRRADDSVARVYRAAPYILRRSRGYAPAPLRMPRQGRPVLACGGELKNTFCLTRGDMAFVSAHIGDLENLATYNSYVAAVAHYKRLFDIEPELVAYDLHPEYLATKYAQESGLPLVGVQHHHAHIAGVLAEHAVDEKVLGVAFDGTGYGPDGHIWGGEFLLADRRDFQRLAHIAYSPLPGGGKAIREPWRLAAWMLHELYGSNFVNKKLPLVAGLPDGWKLLIEATARGINAPLSAGAGRLFDIAAAILGIRSYINYEGQAAVELELAAGGVPGNVLPYEIISGDPLQLNFKPMFAALAEGTAKGMPVQDLAASFHTTLAAATAELVRRMAIMTGVRKVALSGGVFQNLTLLEQVVCRLEPEHTVLLHRQVPPNDGGLAFGQAVVAVERSV